MLVFLDIDGVLVHGGCKNYKDIDPNCVMVLREFCKKYDNAQIIISSTWRIGKTVDDLDFILFSYGMDKGSVVGVTGYDKKGRRGKEILNWLNTYGDDEDEFVVIDDEIFDITDVINPVDVIHVKDGWNIGGLNWGHIENWERRTNR
jgi:hypothetical protein